MSDDDLVIDPAAIGRLREWGGDKLVRQMIRLYLENAQVRLDQIQAGLSGAEPLERTQQGAHSLKSSAANVGARRVNHLAAQLEASAGDGDGEASAALRDQLLPVLDEAKHALETLVEGLPE